LGKNKKGVACRLLSSFPIPPKNTEKNCGVKSCRPFKSLVCLSPKKKWKSHFGRH